jgi:P4 family phage/plasmid primase-like protien
VGFDLSHLPQPLPGLIYAPRDLGVEQYTTTGLFKPDAPDHQLPQLQAVGVILADTDLCDWCMRHVPGTAERALRAAQEAPPVPAGRRPRPKDFVKQALQAAQASGDPEQLEELQLYREKHRGEVEHCLKAVMGLPPTVLVDSGYGYHAYYHLDAWARGQDMGRARELNKAIQKALNHAAGYELFDSGVHDTGTRILRPPGTFNGKGPQPVAVRVVFRSDTRITLHTFQILRPAPLRNGDSYQERDFLTIPPRDVSVDVGALLLDRAGKVAKLWADLESDQSRVDYALLVALQAKKVSLEDSAAAIFVRRQGSEKYKGKPDQLLGYVNRTLNSYLKRQNEPPPDATDLRVYEDDSHVALAADLLQSLGRVFWSSSAGFRSWSDSGGAWVLQEPAVLRRLAQRYDGCLAKNGTRPGFRKIRLQHRDTAGIVKCACDAVVEPDAKQAHVAHFTNGILGEDGVLRDHDPGLRVLAEHARAFPFDVEARAPTWEWFVSDVFKGDADAEQKVLFLQEYIGACLFGAATRFQRHPILIGKRAGNGKSTFIKGVETIFPQAQITASSPQEWGDRFGKMSLIHSRINLVADAESREIIESGGLKNILTGDAVNVDRKNKDPITLIPLAGHILSMNQLPRTRDKSDGFFRRWALITFNRTFDGTTADRSLNSGKTWAVERQGIAAWAVRGMLRLTANGGHYTLPSTHHEEMHDWRRTNDPVLEFLEDHCGGVISLKDPQGAWVSFEVLYKHFNSMGRREGRKADWTKATFGEGLQRHAVPYKRSNGSKYFVRPEGLPRQPHTVPGGFHR